MMEHQDIGTINGKPITKEMLESYTATFERDWMPSEVQVVPTERGRILRALQDMNIPIYEIEALERMAKNNKQTLGDLIRTILQNELLSIND